MLHALSTWLLVAGFLGAGLINAIDTPATRSSLVRWGHPWWCRLTGGLEMVSGRLDVVRGAWRRPAHGVP